jgi:hypothetical protein
MPTATYTPLATVTLGSSASSVSFSSIPASYRDLIIVTNILSPTVDGCDFALRVNGDTGTNYSYVRMYGGSAATGSDSSASATNISGGFGLGNNTTTPAPVTIQIMDYSATDKHKTFLTRLNDMGRSWSAAFASRWANTSAVTSVQVLTTVNNFAAGSTFSLYGVIA